MTSEDESEQSPPPKGSGGRLSIADLAHVQGLSSSTVDSILKSAKAAGRIAEDAQRHRVDVSKITALMGPSPSPVVMSIQRQAEQSRRMHAEWVDRDERMRAQLGKAQDARERETAATLERELESLRLAGQLVDLQQVLIAHQAELVAEQRAQATSARTSRRIEIAVLIVSVLALVVGVAALL